jgi:DNA repair exonuclease SbcCD ATPase subunit
VITNNDQRRLLLSLIADIAKEISTRTQPIQQALDTLSKQQQPLIEAVRELPKQLKAIKDGFIRTHYLCSLQFDCFYLDLDQQTQNKDQTLMNIEKKLNDTQKRSDNNQDMEKALQPFSQIIKTLKDSTRLIQISSIHFDSLGIDQSQAQQQTETKKIDNIEQRLSKTLDTIPKTSDLMSKLNEITANLKQSDPTIKKLSDDLGTMKTLMEKQATSDDILSKINEIDQKQKAALKDIHSKVEPLHQASKDVIFSSINLIQQFLEFQSLDIKKKNDDIANKIDKLIDPLNKVNDQIRHITDKTDDTLKKLDDQLTYLNKNLPAMGDIPKQIGKSFYCILIERNFYFRIIERCT